MPSNDEKAAAGKKDACWVARHRDGGIYTAIAITLAAAVCGGVAGLGSYVLRDAFAASDAKLEEARTGEQRQLLFPDAKSFEPVTAPDIEGVNSAYKADGGGWVFDVTSTQGYHGDVELMVGITADGKVAGIQTVMSNETEGIGSQAISEDYYKNFKGLDATGSLTVEEGSGDAKHIDAVSGATFASKAVADCVNIAIRAFSEVGGK